jgi:hypothetical protein
MPNPLGLTSWSYIMMYVYSKLPHITADNFVLREKQLDFLFVNGYGMAATCAHNNIPANIKTYMHAVKVDSTLKWCKTMQFKNSIVAIQQCQEQDNKKAHTKTFVSFQSKFGTNIIGVNNLLLVKLYVTHKERGRKKYSSKRVYGI